jgi:hypothetical protein
MDDTEFCPHLQERGSVSRSTAATIDARDFPKARFQAELLRVTGPRSYRFVQPAKTFVDISMIVHRQTTQPRANTNP